MNNVAMAAAAREIAGVLQRLADAIERPVTAAPAPKVKRPHFIRVGARNPNSTRGKVRTAVAGAVERGVTINDVYLAVPGPTESALRAHLSVLVKLGEAFRKGDRWFPHP